MIACVNFISVYRPTSNKEWKAPSHGNIQNKWISIISIFVLTLRNHWTVKMYFFCSVTYVAKQAIQNVQQQNENKNRLTCEKSKQMMHTILFAKNDWKELNEVKCCFFSSLLLLMNEISWIIIRKRIHWVINAIEFFFNEITIYKNTCWPIKFPRLNKKISIKTHHCSDRNVFCSSLISLLPSFYAVSFDWYFILIEHEHILISNKFCDNIFFLLSFRWVMKIKSWKKTLFFPLCWRVSIFKDMISYPKKEL